MNAPPLLSIARQMPRPVIHGIITQTLTLVVVSGRLNIVSLGTERSAFQLAVFFIGHRNTYCKTSHLS